MLELIDELTLCERYKMFSRVGGALSRRTLHAWRTSKDFPNPVMSTPRNHYNLNDIKKFESKQGWNWLKPITEEEIVNR